MKKILASLVICIVDLPLAIFATFVLTPFWRWLEATTAIESIGHSGPADWCFILIYSLILVVSVGTWLLFGRKRQTSRQSQGCPPSGF